MQSAIEQEILREAKKRLAKFSRDRYYAHKYRISFKKRTGKRPKTPSHTTPKQWEFHKHFDPRYCINHASFIARGLWTSLQANSYVPVVAQRYAIPKVAGGFRYIDAFSIPDAAVARIFLDSLRRRNAKIFSDSSYAYQENKSPLDAVLRLKPLLKGQTIFVSQYDFSKFFDSIQHSHLERLLERDGPFLTTHMERALLRAILVHSFKEGSEDAERRTVGVPQGNSLSLFLANVAAHPLDEELSRLSGSFARFADDSVVVNYSYEDALACANAFERFSQACGVEINRDKTTGIRIFSDRPRELAHVSEFDFLSYCFRRDGLHVSKKAVRAIKRRCARIIYNHLLLYPKRTRSYAQNRVGVGFRDWDLVTCLNELRAYIYGGRSQAVMEQYLSGETKIRNVSGAVSYFCLVEESSIFRELDGWLIDALYRAYHARVLLLRPLTLGFGANIRARALKKIQKSALIDGSWYDFPDIPMETQAPSFFTAWRAARKSWMRHGSGGVDSQGMGYAY